MRIVNKWWAGLIALTIVSCKEPFDPPVKSTEVNNLVVEGTLNASAGGSTTIRLTRTYPLDNNAQIKPVNGAVLTVEGKDQTLRTIPMTSPGFYTSPGLNLIINNEYRLRIKTTDGKEFLSSYVVAKNTPDIDSISWEQNSEGVKIDVTTHDQTNNTRYYKWDYVETWEIRSQYYASSKYMGNGIVVDRPPAEQVYYCWRTLPSSTILIGSSARLEDDVIFKAPVTRIDQGEEKMGVRYSILMRQVALDKPGYEFYEMMKKTTEQLGTVFDAQPTEIKGNIQCVSNPGELVIGYITAATIKEKRIFIANTQLHNWRFFLNCITYDVPNNKDSLKFYFDGGAWQPYEAVTVPPNTITHYSSSYPTCVDCTSRGGSTTRPSFW